MVKHGRTLVVLCFLVTILAIFVGFSMRLNGLGYTAVWVVPIGFWVWLGVLANAPRLEVRWQGSTQWPAREENGDHHIHSGGFFHSLVITARNTGLKKLSLEPRMILRDVQTGARILEMNQMEICPLSMQKADIHLADNPMVKERPPHCPPKINLDVDSDSVTYHLEFLADKFWVDRIGLTKIVQSCFSLRFVDTVHGAFDFKVGRNKKGRPIIECKHSRVN